MSIISNCLAELGLVQNLAKIKELTPLSVKKLPNPLLLDYHRKTHMLYSSAIKRIPPNKEFINTIINIHDLIVKEMLKRKLKHTTPLKKI
ncbi:MAG: hypothetical protein PVG65_04420 [Candidatus Thorarchaeota archaeon]|jgi:hypothetical protein